MLQHWCLYGQWHCSEMLLCQGLHLEEVLRQMGVYTLCYFASCPCFRLLFQHRLNARYCKTTVKGSSILVINRRRSSYHCAWHLCFTFYLDSCVENLQVQFVKAPTTRFFHKDVLSRGDQSQQQDIWSSFFHNYKPNICAPHKFRSQKAQSRDCSDNH